MISIEKLFNKYKLIKKKKIDYSANEKAIIEFVTNLVNFYKIYDIHEHTKHSEIFDLLFLNKRKLSSENISQKMFISVKTLYRFKMQYLAFISAALNSEIFGSGIGHILTEISS